MNQINTETNWTNLKESKKICILIFKTKKKKITKNMIALLRKDHALLISAVVLVVIFLAVIGDTAGIIHHQLDHLTLFLIGEMALIPFFVRTGAEASLEAKHVTRFSMLSAVSSFAAPTLVGMLLGYIYGFDLRLGLAAAPTCIVMVLIILKPLKKILPPYAVRYMFGGAVLDDVISAFVGPFLHGNGLALVAILCYLAVVVAIAGALNRGTYEYRSFRFYSKMDLDETPDVKVKVQVPLWVKMIFCITFCVVGVLKLHISPLLTALMFLYFATIGKEEELKTIEESKVLVGATVITLPIFVLVSIGAPVVIAASEFVAEYYLMLSLVFGAKIVGFSIPMFFDKSEELGSKLDKFALACMSGMCMTMALAFISHMHLPFELGMVLKTGIMHSTLWIAIFVSMYFVISKMIFPRLEDRLEVLDFACAIVWVMSGNKIKKLLSLSCEFMLAKIQRLYALVKKKKDDPEPVVAPSEAKSRKYTKVIALHASAAVSSTMTIIRPSRLARAAIWIGGMFLPLYGIVSVTLTV